MRDTLGRIRSFWPRESAGGPVDNGVAGLQPWHSQDDIVVANVGDVKDYPFGTFLYVDLKFFRFFKDSSVFIVYKTSVYRF